MTDFKHIQREVRNDGVCVLTFDRANSPANLFDTPTFEELNAHLDYLEGATQSGSVQGVIFRSAKGKIFIAGADLHGFTSGAMTDERLGGIIDGGHRTFARIHRMSVPTVAAIQGVCVGGGTELTLACDWRVACNDSATKIGLPEVQIGILPAWGGSVRLPRLIGLPKALEIILTGKQLAGVPARKCGLVDDIAYPEGLLATAERFIRRGKRPAARTILANLPPARGSSPRSRAGTRLPRPGATIPPPPAPSRWPWKRWARPWTPGCAWSARRSSNSPGPTRPAT